MVAAPFGMYQPNRSSTPEAQSTLPEETVVFSFPVTGPWVRRMILLAALAVSLALPALAWADAAATGMVVWVGWSLPL